MAYATASDVETELGRPAASSAETEQWEAWLDRVERSITRGFRRAGLDLTTQVGLDAPPESDVVDVEVARVIDKIQNPMAGQTSVTRSIDDASVTYRREGAGVTGDPLELSAADWSALLPNGGRRSRAFSIMPS